MPVVSHVLYDTLPLHEFLFLTFTFYNLYGDLTEKSQEQHLLCFSFSGNTKAAVHLPILKKRKKENVLIFHFPI